MFDWLIDGFTSAVSSTTSWLDTTLGTTMSSATAGSAAEWAAFDKVGFDQITNFGLENTYGGIMEIGAIELGAYNIMDFVGGALGSDAVKNMVGSPFGDDTKYPAFADKSGRSQRMAGIGANFQASKSRYPGTNDPRVQQAWRQARNSTNPSLITAISTIDPNIVAKTNLSLSPAVIKRRKAYGA